MPQNVVNMDDMPDSFTPKNAPALTTVEPDNGPDQKGYRKMARKQTFEGKQYAVSDLMTKLNARKNGPYPATSWSLLRVCKGWITDDDAKENLREYSSSALAATGLMDT